VLPGPVPAGVPVATGVPGRTEEAGCEEMEEEAGCEGMEEETGAGAAPGWHWE
jgi:hypothetical protein